MKNNFSKFLIVITALVIVFAFNESALAEDCKDTEFCTITEESKPPNLILDEGKSFVSGGYNTTTLKDYELCDCISWRIVGLAFACDQWECFSTHDVIVPATTTWVYATITNPYINASTSVSVGTTTAYVKEPLAVYPFYSATLTAATGSVVLIDKSWNFGQLFFGFWVCVAVVIYFIKLAYNYFYPSKVRIQRKNDY